MTTEHRRAPRRTIVNVSREGAWGKVKYKHLLDCGHTEVRDRASTSPTLACAWCLRINERSKEIDALSRTSRKPYIDESSSLANNEISISKARAALSSKFGVPLDSVDIASSDVNGNFEINYALIFLSSGDVARLMKP